MHNNPSQSFSEANNMSQSFPEATDVPQNFSEATNNPSQNISEISSVPQINTKNVSKASVSPQNVSQMNAKSIVSNNESMPTISQSSPNDYLDNLKKTLSNKSTEKNTVKNKSDLLQNLSDVIHSSPNKTVNMETINSDESFNETLKPMPITKENSKNVRSLIKTFENQNNYPFHPAPIKSKSLVNSTVNSSNLLDSSIESANLSPIKPSNNTSVLSFNPENIPQSTKIEDESSFNPPIASTKLNQSSDISRRNNLSKENLPTQQEIKDYEDLSLMDTSSGLQKTVIENPVVNDKRPVHDITTYQLTPQTAIQPRTDRARAALDFLNLKPKVVTIPENLTLSNNSKNSSIVSSQTPHTNHTQDVPSTTINPTLTIDTQDVPTAFLETQKNPSSTVYTLHSNEIPTKYQENMTNTVNTLATEDVPSKYLQISKDNLPENNTETVNTIATEDVPTNLVNSSDNLTKSLNESKVSTNPTITLNDSELNSENKTLIPSNSTITLNESELNSKNQTLVPSTSNITLGDSEIPTKYLSESDDIIQKIRNFGARKRSVSEMNESKEDIENESESKRKPKKNLLVDFSTADDDIDYQQNRNIIKQNEYQENKKDSDESKKTLEKIKSFRAQKLITPNLDETIKWTQARK